MPHTGVNKDKDDNRMAKCKTPPTTPGEQIAQQILNNYDIKSADDKIKLCSSSKNLIATPTGVELIQLIHEELLKSPDRYR